MITTYHVLITIQIVALVVGIYGLYSLFGFMLRPEAKFLLGASVAVVAYGLGYLTEMLSTNQDMAFDALCLQYCGLAYVAFMFAVYLDKYTQALKVPSAVWKGIFLYETITLFLMLTSRYHRLYFKELSFTQEGLFPHLVEKGTFLFYLFMAHLAALSLLCCIIAAKVILQTNSRKRRKAFTGILAAAGLTLLAMIFSIAIGFEGYEPISAIILLVIGIIAIVKTAGKTSDPAELAYAEFFYRTFAGLIVTDVSYRYQDSNDRAKEIFPELGDMETGTIFSYAPKIISAQESQERIQIGDRHYTTYYYPLKRKTLLGYLLVLADVTELENNARELERLKKAAEEASEAKTFFLANMSHEMRTPLNAILGLAELAQKEDTLDASREYLPQILSSGHMLLDIISDVLDFSKAESGKVDILPVSYDVKELLNTVINIVNIRLGDKDLDFIINIDPTIPSRLNGDDGRIRQILVNFLSNAVKYTDKGFIRLDVDWERLGSEMLLKLAVSDSGRGIKQEDIGRLFSVFSRLDLNNNRNIQGTGLGLAISGHLIKRMNGTYRVESEYGKGSTFYCILPQKIESEKPLSDQERHEIHLQKNVPFVLYGNAETTVAAAADAIRAGKGAFAHEKEDNPDEQKKGPHSGAAVLIVDDNSVNIKVLSAMLRSFGISADTALNGPDAIEMVQKKAYDLILMDHMMPDMDGIEATEKIRALDAPWVRDMAIIACTANAVKGAERMFLENGMNDYICKPVKLAQLQEKLDQWL
ncbi:MAG: response regulator [Lachnospiraceae bacterium]|nr:response regulator [Lachnospiraceae bacterium]